MSESLPSSKDLLSPGDVALALKQARTRGLPNGWTVTLDKRRRRKWIAPNGRSCDSIPKALVISKQIGLLPPDSVIDSHTTNASSPLKKKGKKSSASTAYAAAAAAKQPQHYQKQKSSTGTITKKRPASSHSSGPASKKATTSTSASTTATEQEGDQPKLHQRMKYPKYSPPPLPPPSPPPEPEVDPGSDSDPEVSYHVSSSYSSHASSSKRDDAASRSATKPTTVHWDPNCIEGSKVGWKIRLWCKTRADWKDGRVLRYDPYTHKHKVQYSEAPRKVDVDSGNVDKENCIWLRLVDEVTQLGTRFVWAHVKGFAWWPAQVMDCDPQKITQREGYVFVGFFGSDQVATLRDSIECVRPFDGGKVDSFILKNKKKRNSKAVEIANHEQTLTQNARNEAARFYAKQAFAFVNKRAMNVLGKRVEVFRSDVNYPYGDTMIGTVRKYSSVTKRWLLTYTTTSQYEPSWVNLQARECNYKVIDSNKKTAHKPNDLDLVPFMHGFVFDETDKHNKNIDKDRTSEDAAMAQLLSDHCRGCLEPISKGKQTQITLECDSCGGRLHPECLDSPLTQKAAQRILDEGGKWHCSRCTPCLGCLQQDVAFGSNVLHPSPPTLTLPEGEKQLHLCSMCVTAYEQERFCCNCAHSWDDEIYQKIQKRISWNANGRDHSGKGKGRRKKKKKKKTDAAADDPKADGNASQPEQIEIDLEEDWEIDPSWYFHESEIWGFNEGAMLICDSCNLWVHAGCAKLTKEEYEESSAGEHPIYSSEFLCRICCKRRCKKMIEALQVEDTMHLFAFPVTEQMAPNYHDVIQNPMDLQTMAERVLEEEVFLNYAWVREDFELMVLNALAFNSYYSQYWNEAKRFYNACMKTVFASLGKAAPPGPHSEAVEKNFADAIRSKQMEKERVKEDETTEKKDLVVGSGVAIVALPPLREPRDQPSCLPFTEVLLKAPEAYFCSWMECCFTCGSSGASDTMLFCVDCGEAYHSFCVNAPIHSMERSSVAGWRCPNCKICEISGEVPKDELKMLFCEMCDRAFSLDLLDPPLKSAPPGLWICGQCVDCKSCGNTLEKNGASLKYWSRDPQKCYRCGGCNGLIEKAKHSQKCVMCTRLWRKGDKDLVDCSSCNSGIHVACDSYAEDYLKQNRPSKRSIKAGVEETKYECPPCRKKQRGDLTLGKMLRKQLHDQAWLVILQGTLAPHANYTFIELHEKLSQEIDWRIRNLWADDYRAVIQEGLRLLAIARERLGSTKAMMELFSAGRLDLPPWMGQRAARFVRRSKRAGWDIAALQKKEIEALVSMAKAAASFMKVACRAIGINTKKNVKCYSRMVKLLKAPDSCGLIEPPIDTVRTEGNRSIIQEKEWASKFVPQINLAIPAALALPLVSKEYGKGASASDDSESGRSIGFPVTPNATNGSSFTIADPLLGWSDILAKDDSLYIWKDPRQCCLCRTYGDDDAGLPPQSESTGVVAQRTLSGGELVANEPKISRLGRLLPMSGGLWVHASCALWSSEVWEAPSGGVIHAMDKARSRGAQLKCFGCGRPGATLGCSKTNCSSNYHFPCAKACGAVFTSKQLMFCSNHTSNAGELTKEESFEHMRPLSFDKQIATDEDHVEGIETTAFIRIGSFIVHSLGIIDQKHDGFHSKIYISPPGYVATRIFWSILRPKTRTVYVLKIDRVKGIPVFSATPGDDPGARVRGRSAEEVYKNVIARVQATNRDHFSQGDMFSKLPMVRNYSKPAYGLSGPQFFGFGINSIRRAIESLPGAEATVAPLIDSSPSYEFCYVQPTVEAITTLQRKRAAVAAEKALENPSGSARTEGMSAVALSGGSGRITRALVKSANVEAQTDGAGRRKIEEESQTDRDSNQLKYKEFKSVPMEQRLSARRSHIHGWGLFTKNDLKKHSIIIEYMGEVVRQCIADKREKAYEEAGVGSCYMFRLDMQRIVDATMIGCMARFMNHCCRPNAYAKVITVDTDQGPEKKIVVFANKDIAANEEITYDYKFPVEDGSLKCTCGAPNCIGRMN